MSNRLKILIAVLLLILGAALLPLLSRRSGRNRSEALTQILEESKNQTDSLRSAMKYLERMTPMNRKQTVKEVQLGLNTWIQTADRTGANYRPPKVLEQFPVDQLEFVGCKSPLELQFSTWDVDYLYQRRMMEQLAEWIVDFPLRDSLVQSFYDRKKDELTAEQAVRLEEACKLFDWVMRNVALEPDLSSVEQKIPNPEGPIAQNGPGYGYLPWETLLFSRGDFIEKGRVFTALAYQRGITAAWIVDQGYMWAIAVLVGDELLIFEPKLAFPVLDPDELVFANLKESIENERVLRRLDLPGRFEYAFDPGDLESLELLIDLPPTAGSARMKMLEQNLLSNERMRLFHDLDAMAAELQAAAPAAKVRVWQVPMMAQIHASMVREQLSSVSDFTAQYMSKHGIWMMDNPAANGRLKHLFGNFESTLEGKGALSLYMDSRYDDESIRKLEFDPTVRNELGVPRMPGEEQEVFTNRIRQAQYVFRKAKVDAAFLMAQLHFDRGNLTAAENWFRRRVIDNDNPLAAQWNAIGRYGLARVYQQMGDLEKASEQLTYEPSPMEAGNRLRLRYLRDFMEDVQLQDAEPQDAE